MSGIILVEASRQLEEQPERRYPDGLFKLNGEPARGTRKPIGTAYRLRFTNSQRWFEGSALYRLDPPIQIVEYGRLTETSYVIVANVPASQVANRATIVFAASGQGTLFGRFRNDPANAEVGPRFFGGYDHRRVLNALQGGYVIDNSIAKAQSKRKRSRRA